jgi:uncharacterized protein YbaR (Trm112 family)
MICPGCSQEMSQQTCEGNYAKLVTLDICHPCASLWFDGLESLALAPGAVLRLFIVMNDNQAAQRNPLGDHLSCPRCRQLLVLTTDMQRSTRFRYWRCPAEHGHLITFFEFLREKNFIRPLTAAEVERLKQNVRTITCSSCGAPVDLTAGSACPYCRAPLSMLDAKQVDTVVQQLKQEDAKRQEARLDPALAARLMQDRLSVEHSFATLGLDPFTFGPASSGGLVEAGVAALVSLLKGD